MVRAKKKSWIYKTLDGQCGNEATERRNPAENYRPNLTKFVSGDMGWDGYGSSISRLAAAPSMGRPRTS